MNTCYRWLGVLCLAYVLQGCASAPGAVPHGKGTGKEWVTESDESEDSKRSRIRLELARGYFEQNQLTVALDQVKLALQADPNNAQALNMKGLIYMGLNEPQVAEDSFHQALRINPKDANTLHNLGWFYCQQKRYAQAMDQFAKALAVPNYLDAGRTWMAQGVCQINAQQVAEAELSLKRAFEFNPGNPLVLYNLASLTHQRGDSERARFYARRLNNSELASAESLWLGIKIENRLQNREAAQQLADQLKRRFPDSRETNAYSRGAFNE